MKKMYTGLRAWGLIKNRKNKDPELVNKNVVYLLKKRRRFKETGEGSLFTKGKKREI